MSKPDSDKSPDDLPDHNPAAGDVSSSGGSPPGSAVALTMHDEPERTRIDHRKISEKSTVNGAQDATLIPPIAVHEEIHMTVTAEFLPNDRSGLDDALDIQSRVGTRSVNSSAKQTDSFGPTLIFADPQTNRDQPLLDKEIGPYEILGELGRGGMGVVYKARHKQLRREVALKMVLGGGIGDSLMSRFHLEAQSVAALKHPGIVQIHEYGQHRGAPWFALELVDGATLQDLSGSEPFEPERAARLVADLASAVGYAHSNGVLHRDIKPANVLVTRHDVAKLTDFGLAKRVVTDDLTERSLDHKTVDGQIMGTPSYMPPEQARGDAAAVGPHSDQYALGATLYRLLTGRAPFVGAKPIEVLMQVMQDEPLTVRQLQPSTPLDLDTICMKAMAREPARRYSDCAAMEADLRRFLRNEPILARPISSVERLVRWCRRNPKIAIPISTTVLTVIGFFGVMLASARMLNEKNKRIEIEKNVAVENGKLARRRAIESKDSVAEMLIAIRKNIPMSEQKLRPVRKALLRIASNQLERLPDNPDDEVLNSGLEKSRILEEQYFTALELGEPTRALGYLDAAEKILRERNEAQGTDVTRQNLTTVLYYQAQARISARRDMKKVCSYGAESLAILNDVQAHPKPVPFDEKHGSVEPLEVQRQIMMNGYQQALHLRKLGRVDEGFKVIDLAVGQFDASMEILRKREPFNSLSDDEWAGQKQVFRGMIGDQDQLRAMLLASIGRVQEAVTEQQRVLANVRQLVATDGSPENWSKLALSLVFTGDLARQQGDIDKALAAYTESVGITRQIYQLDPALADYRNVNFIALMRLAGMTRSRDMGKAKELYAEARKIAEDMVKSDIEAITAQISLALISPFSGPPAKAVELADSTLSKFAVHDAEIDIDLARVWSAAAEAESLAEMPDRAAIESWKQRAIELIAEAVASGYRDGAYLAGEPDFTAIRSLPKFQELLNKCVPNGN